MTVHTLLIVLACLLSAGLAAVLASAIWQHRPREGAAWLTVTLLGLALWGLGQAVGLAAGRPPVVVGWFTVSLVGMGLTALPWLFFSLRYTGRDDRLRSWMPPLVLSPIVAIVGLVLVAPFRVYLGATVTPAGTFVFEWGTPALAFFGYAYLVGLCGSVVLSTKIRHSRNVYRRRTAFFFSAGLVLLAGHALSLAGASPFPYHTLVPILFLAIGAGSLAILYNDRVLTLVSFDHLSSLASGRFEELGLAPLARDAVIEELESGVVVLDGDNRVVDINPAARRLLEAERDRIVGTPVEQFVDTDRFLADDLPFLDPSVTEGTFSELWVEFEDDTRRCYDIELTGLESGGETVGRVGLIHDVTTIQRQNEQLQAQKRELERQNEQLEEFAGIVSHDLRNPLNVAMGNVTVARETGDLDHLDTVETSLDRMENIIDDVLTLARQGQSIDETETVRLGTVAENAWETVDTVDATLAVEVPPEGAIEADATRLQQLFENLFRNSVEHGGPDVTVRVDCIDDGFAVEDDGPGIPPDERESVLEQGYTTNENGTGFGLSIVSTIASAHGWDVSVTESTDGGARFEFSGVERVDESVRI